MTAAPVQQFAEDVRKAHTLGLMANSLSSVSVEASLEKVVGFTADDSRLREFVFALEGGQPVEEVKEWVRRADRHRHRIEWQTVGLRGWLEASRRGQVTAVTAEVHTNEPDPDLDAHLDAALIQLKAEIEAVDAADIGAAEASPSLVVETVLKELIRAIPRERRAAMKPYLDRAPQLDASPERERRRAALCVKWAAELAEDHKAGLARLAARVEEDVKHLEGKMDADLVEAERPMEAAWFKRPDAFGAGEVPPDFHTELNEIFDALAEAHKVAVHEGWDAVPWPGLLEDLFNA
jgi:hypothetical protein